MGVPSDVAHIMHPDGRTTPAMFVEVSADCKVHLRSTTKHCKLHPTQLTYGNLQVVLIVAQDLGMRPGKVGAQCAHAAVGLYKVTVAQKAPWLSAWEVCKTLVPYVFRISAVLLHPTYPLCACRWFPATQNALGAGPLFAIFCPMTDL